jgi:integrase
MESCTMPRSISVPKYSLHKPTGQAYVRVGGKFHYLGRYDSAQSRKEYGRIIAELAVNPVVPSSHVQHEITIVELCASYWEYAENYYVKDGKPTDHIGTVKRAIGIVRELYSDLHASEFGPLAYRSVQNALVVRGLSRSTVNSTGGAIRRMFRWAASLELISAAVFQALSTVPGLKAGRTAARETEPVKPVENAVVDACIPFMPPVIADMVRFQRLTGARPGEICQLRPMDVDRTGEVWEYRPMSHKTQHHDKSRVVFVGPQAQALLQPYVLRAPQVYCFSPEESEEKRHKEMRSKRKTPVQPSQKNRKKARPLRQPKTFYTKDSNGRAINRAIKKANEAILKDAAEMGIDNPELIPHWHPNQLRHTAATAIRKQFGLEAAQIILGHSKADVTQIYAERDTQKAVEVIRKIG